MTDTPGPMTLGNMRALGVRSIELTCLECHHSVALDVGAYPDERTVPSFRGRCTRWPEMQMSGMWKGQRRP